ncbi:MAG: ParA family protein [Clostridiales bacterium]|nr:ParA family protein [Clostridiales bacterium]
MGKIIAVTNQKGGVGKTTSCVNLASYVADAGHKVLLIDMDPQGNACSSVGVEVEKDQNSIYEVLLGEVKIKEAIYPSVLKGLDCIPSTVDLSGAEVDLVYMDNREKILKEALNEIKDAYDYIFIDCPPSLGLLTVNALTATNTIIIPIQCEYFALVGLGQLMNTVRLIKKHLNPEIEIEGVLLTMKDNRSNLVAQVSEEIKKYFGTKVYNTYIPRNVRLAESPSHGKPIVMYDNKSKGALAYKSLADEFLKKQ